MGRKYVVIGYYADTKQRYAEAVEAESASAAERAILLDVKCDTLVITGTVSAVDGEVEVALFPVNVTTLVDLEGDEYGTAERCPAGGEHIPDYETVSHEDGMGDVVDVACVNCGRSGSVRISAEDIMW